MNDKLLELNTKIQLCTNCELHKIKCNIKNINFGYGKLYGKMFGEQILFFLIGQNPSYRRFSQSEYAFGGNDNKGGFGDNFCKMLEELDILKYCYITNIVKCSTNNNEKFSYESLKECSKYIIEEIRILNPKKIIALGNIVYDSLMLLKIGSLFNKELIKMYHPNYYFSYNIDRIKEYKQSFTQLKESI